MQTTTIAWADISFNKYSPDVYAGIVVLSYPKIKPLFQKLVKVRVSFPDVLGYLAFREVPALLQAWNLLPLKPDVLIVDGHGIAHPRAMGIEVHLVHLPIRQPWAVQRRSDRDVSLNQHMRRDRPYQFMKRKRMRL